MKTGCASQGRWGGPLPFRCRGRTLGVPQVYAVASEDMDSLTFGAPRFLRHLMEPASRKMAVMEFDMHKVR